MHVAGDLLEGGGVGVDELGDLDGLGEFAADFGAGAAEHDAFLAEVGAEGGGVGDDHVLLLVGADPFAGEFVGGAEDAGGDDVVELPDVAGVVDDGGGGEAEDECGVLGHLCGGGALVGVDAVSEFLDFVEDDGRGPPFEVVAPPVEAGVGDDEHVGVLAGHECFGGGGLLGELDVEPRECFLELGHPPAREVGGWDDECGEGVVVDEVEEAGVSLAEAELVGEDEAAAGAEEFDGGELVVAGVLEGLHREVQAVAAAFGDAGDGGHRFAVLGGSGAEAFFRFGAEGAQREAFHEPLEVAGDVVCVGDDELAGAVVPDTGEDPLGADRDVRLDLETPDPARGAGAGAVVVDAVGAGHRPAPFTQRERTSLPWKSRSPLLSICWSGRVVRRMSAEISGHAA